MIPQRVHLQGFLSYREPQEFDFRHAPLWVLSGPNGAGKSAVFDAILFALYGASRAGKKPTKALINHGSQSLAIELDIALGEVTYRLKRTLSRKGRPSFQISTVLEDGRLEAVSGTERVDGYSSWVEREVGLSYESFCCAVMLVQGRSDALLAADAADRHKVLTQIVDLSPYEALHDRACARRAAAVARVSAADAQLGRLGEADPAELRAIALEAENAEAARTGAAKALVEAGRLREQAARFKEIAEEHKEVAAALEQAKATLERADEIEADVKRLADLERVLPDAARLAGYTDRMGTAEAVARTGASAAEGLVAEAVRLEALALKAAEATQALRAKRAEAAETAAAGSDTVGRLAADIHALDELDRLTSQTAEFEAKLEALAAPDPEALAETAARLDTLVELRGAMPWVRRLARSRKAERVARTAAERERARDFAGPLAAATERAEAASAAETAATLALEGALEREVGARLGLESAELARARLEAVAGGATCSHCRQPLTLEHLTSERGRLDALADEASQAVEATDAAASKARSQVAAATKEATASAAALRALEAASAASALAAEAAEAAASRACADGDEALAEIAASVRARFGLDAGAVPEEDALVAADAEVSGVETLREALARERQAVEQRSKLEASVAGLSPRLAELAALYPRPRAEALRTEYAAAERGRAEARAQVKALDKKLSKAESAALTADNAARTARECANTASAEADRLAASVRKLEESVRVVRAGLPASWKDEGPWTQALVAKLGRERSALGRARAEAEELGRARVEVNAIAKRLARIEAEATKIPKAARKPLDASEAAEREARAASAEVERRIVVLRSREAELKRVVADRASLEATRAEALSETGDYERLARLLDKEHLQRYLLEEAEAEIVDNANRVLERVSGGTLSIALEGSETRTGGQKALDLVAYNSETGGEAEPVAMLSGSQRFRVAIALALAIGQFASSLDRAVEAVIIDEGFGSLDKEGRGAVIDELHELKSVLGRIVLVSHQEEFARSFQNAYHVEIVDTSSRATLVGAL